MEEFDELATFPPSMILQRTQKSLGAIDHVPCWVVEDVNTAPVNFILRLYETQLTLGMVGIKRATPMENFKTKT